MAPTQETLRRLRGFQRRGDPAAVAGQGRTARGDDGAKNSRASRSPRNAARISTVIAASGLREGFASDSVRAQLTVDLGSLARELGALDAPTEDVASQQRVIAAADRAVAPRLDAVRTAMTGLPDARDGVDPATRAALASSPMEWKALQVEQSRQADLADRASQRSDRMDLAALLSALAASLAALAAASAIPSPSRLWAAVALFVGGLVATATALFG